MKYSNVYIAGCGGMLGSSVYKAFSEENKVYATDIDVNEDFLSYADVRDFSKIEKDIKNFKPDLLINLSALTDLENCETDFTNCMMTNTIGAINLMEIAKNLNIPYIFISTAGVFDGKKDSYIDNDIPVPLSIYAKSKVYAENYILKNYNKSWIFRAGWMMGGGINKDKKFISKILQQIDNNCKELFIVDDKLGTPTYTFDFALSLLKHYNEKLPYGVYNMVCKGNASRYDVALEIKKILKLDYLKITKVDSSYFKNTYFAPRPPSEKLINSKLEKLNKNYMRDWKVCLKEYLKVFYEK